MWWPPALRRPNDFYLRLPFPARLVRAVLSVLFALVPAMIIWRAALLEQLGHVSWFAPIELACLVIALVTVGCGALWVSRYGLSLEEGAQVLFGATTPQPWWEKPKMLALLAPPRGSRVRAPERNTPHDHRRAIAELLAIPPFAATELASLSRQSADRMTDAIAQADREIVTLSKAASHAEVSRLASQLATLEQDGLRSETTNPLRDLLRQQLDVLHTMQAQCEGLAQRRAHRMELLHGLWAQLAQAMDTDTPSLGTEREAAIRALCREMEHELATPTTSPLVLAPSLSVAGSPPARV
jgi:hypothetical protein